MIRFHRHDRLVLILLVLAVMGDRPSARAAEDASPFALSDRFDVDQAAGKPIAGWEMSIPQGAVIEVVTGAEVNPDTLPNCVRLFDGSTASRPEIYRRFSAPLSAGVMTLRVRLPRHGAAPLGVQLRSQRGKLLAAVMLLDSARAAYTTGDQNVSSPVVWPSNTWATLRIDWDETGHFNAYLDKRPVATHVALATKEVPGQVLISAGTGSGEGAEAYVDGLEVVGPPPATAGAEIGSLTHGVWMAHDYCVKPAYAARTAEVVERLARDYAVGSVHLNIGLVDAEGNLPFATTGYPALGAFLAGIEQAEAGANKTIRVTAWINGNTEKTDLSRPEVRAAIIDECIRFLSPTSSRSYLGTAKRSFDGVQLDFEPSGLDPERFASLLQLTQSLRRRIEAEGLSDKTISIASHTLGEGGKWRWPAQFFYDMATHVDEIAVMTYDGGAADGTAYQHWIAAQLRDVLRAVSGTHWSDDAHPPITNPVRITIGLPAYSRRTAAHRPEAESVIHGVLGVREAINALVTERPDLLALLAGTALYAHADDAGEDGYASLATDWHDFRRYLLSKP